MLVVPGPSVFHSREPGVSGNFRGRIKGAIEGEFRGLKELLTSLCDAEGRVQEPRKEPHKPLPSKCWPSVQGRIGEQKH